MEHTYFYFKDSRDMSRSLIELWDEDRDHPVTATSVSSGHGECYLTHEITEDIVRFENLLIRLNISYEKNSQPKSHLWNSPFLKGWG